MWVKLSATLFDDKGKECHIGDTIQCTTYSDLEFKGELTAVTISSIDIRDTKCSSINVIKHACGNKILKKSFIIKFSLKINHV